jgi:DNA-binding winged helix-turn-helix (wHTH) protein/predicted ATPase
MFTRTNFAFPPFRLDATNQELWRNREKIVLRPKTFSLLHYFLEHPHRLVSKHELLEAVWPGVFVTDAVLRGCIHEVRNALGDDPRRPRFLNTLPRRGYRFIGELAETGAPGRSLPQVELPIVEHPSLEGRDDTQPASLIERERELAELRDAYEQALRNRRQQVFITGEPGIGKTTLIDAFLDELAARGGVWIARGQCIEQYGAGEAYMPVLEALSSLCRRPGAEEVVKILDRCAPTWLEQMPSLLNAAEVDALHRRNLTSSRKRMLRELAEAVEMLATQQPLVLVFEDLHHSDPATVDAISLLGQRRQSARLLLLGTYRPAEIRSRTHTLRNVVNELQLRGLLREIPLRFLTQAAVDRYLEQRFNWSSAPRGLSRLIHHHTDGNPLFMVGFVNLMTMNRVIAPIEGRWQSTLAVEQITLHVPDSLRQLVEKQIEGLSPKEQRLLDAASVAGGTFSTASTASLGEDPVISVDEIEDTWRRLARRGLMLKTHGIEELPEGGVVARYSFIHELYRQVLYERLSPRRRARLHILIGESKERAFSNRASEIAGELALHFEEGRDYRRAIKYLELAARNVVSRYANREGIAYLTRGLKLLEVLPEDSQTLEQELGFLTILGPAVLAIKGYTAIEVGRTYARARDLCQRLGKPLFTVLRGLWVFYYMRADLPTALELGEELLKLAEREESPALLVEAHYALAATQTCRGKIGEAHRHATQSIALYDPIYHRQHTFHYGQDPGVYSLLWESMDLWFLGFPDQAREKCLAMLTVAREAAHPFSLTTALFMASILHQLRGEEARVQQFTDEGGTLANEHGFAFWSAWTPIMEGWILTNRGQFYEGLNKITAGARALEAMETLWFQPYFLSLLAHVYGRCHRPQDGLSVIMTALRQSQKTGQQFFDAELYRLGAELQLMKNSPAAEVEAEKYFERAVETARGQDGRSLELRALVSRAQSLSSKRRDGDKTLLKTVLDQFTEGFATRDLCDAKALLDGYPH